jgi:hypothetical protein
VVGFDLVGFVDDGALGTGFANDRAPALGFDLLRFALGGGVGLA